MTKDNQKNIQTKTAIIKRKFIGIVVSNKMEKTLVVRIESRKLHHKYNKYYKVSKNYYVHDQKEIAKEGDKVAFVECRPLSKSKRWRLTEIIK
ncbi:MAG: 30S ribosomal protein S17 [Parcubacteria group bacterium]|nr:30S ribosomal protein S17 [Parcubacteria group bacterium]